MTMLMCLLLLLLCVDFICLRHVKFWRFPFSDRIVIAKVDSHKNRKSECSSWERLAQKLNSLSRRFASSLFHPRFPAFAYNENN